MDRLEKCKLALQKGFSYDKNTGIVYGPKGGKCERICNGYYTINLKIGGGSTAKQYNLKAHHFVWFIETGEIVECIDHVDRNKLNNHIDNLRSVTIQENRFNTNSKGYKLDKRSGKYESRIIVDRKYIHLGTFESELDAKNAYLEAKKIYHKVCQ